MDPDSYISEIEKYFLSLKGSGVMLSSTDYNSIIYWNEKNIPKEVILRGIKSAFKNHSRARNKKLNSIYQCLPFIEQSISLYKISDKKNNSICDEVAIDNLIEGIKREIRIAIKSQSNLLLKEELKKMESEIDKIKNLDENTFYIKLKEFDDKLLNKIFKKLTKMDADRIMSEAEKKIEKRSLYMSFKAREESLLSFRNQIIKDKFNLNSIFSYE